VSLHNLNIIEQVLLKYLNWHPMIPTPIEFVRLILFFANTSQDFTKIILRSAEECIKSLSIFNISFHFYPSTIALAALMTVLEELGYLNFMNDLACLIVDYDIGFDIEATNNC
jgi:hypothetical protein